MHHVMTMCFQTALPYLVKKVGGSTDGPCDWTPTHSTHVELSIEPASLNTILCL